MRLPPPTPPRAPQQAAPGTAAAPVDGAFVFAAAAMGLRAPLLVRARVRAPRVTLDPPAVNLRTVLVGGRARGVVTLFNGERTPFAFTAACAGAVVAERVVAPFDVRAR